MFKWFQSNDRRIREKIIDKLLEADRIGDKTALVNNAKLIVNYIVKGE